MLYFSSQNHGCVSLDRAVSEPAWRISREKSMFCGPGQGWFCAYVVFLDPDAWFCEPVQASAFFIKPESWRCEPGQGDVAFLVPEP